MNRKKTWRFDLNKMGAKSYGSVRPFGGEPQPLKEIKLLEDNQGKVGHKKNENLPDYA